MIVRDEYGIVCQPQPDGFLDGGDSASRMGLLVLSGYTENLEQFILPGGLVRHPFQSLTVGKDEQWNDPKDCSRDQLVCFLAGLHKQGRTDLGLKLRKQYKLFINNDLLAPDVQYMLSKVANHWTKYLWFLPGQLFTLLSVLWSAKVKPDHELNQVISLCSVNNTKLLKLLTKLHPNWKANLDDYWNNWRNQPEISMGLKLYVYEQSIK